MGSISMLENVQVASTIELPAMQMSSTRTPGKIQKRGTNRRVTFMWKEWVYDEAGTCQIGYSKWSSRSTTKVYLKETRHGGRLDTAQLESHWKFKSARTSHQAMLRRVEEEIGNQRGKRERKVNQPKTSTTKRNITISDHPRHHPTVCPLVAIHISPAIVHPAERIVKSSLPQQITRISKVKYKHKSTTDIKTGKTKTKQQTTTTETSTRRKASPTTLWIQHARGIWALHASKPSYLLPLPWQHQAWIAPTHRKTLRQEPFIV
jgi:hypothetical protein